MVCGLQKDYNLFLTFRTLKSKEIPSMPHVVCEACIGCKRTDCVDVCPVDCFREGPNFLVIDPDECIDCAVCIPECPEAAIFAEETSLRISRNSSRSTPSSPANGPPLRAASPTLTTPTSTTASRAS